MKPFGNPERLFYLTPLTPERGFFFLLNFVTFCWPIVRLANLILGLQLTNQNNQKGPMRHKKLPLTFHHLFKTGFAFPPFSFPLARLFSPKRKKPAVVTVEQFCAAVYTFRNGRQISEASAMTNIISEISCVHISFRLGKYVLQNCLSNRMTISVVI